MHGQAFRKAHERMNKSVCSGNNGWIHAPRIMKKKQIK